MKYEKSASYSPELTIYTIYVGGTALMVRKRGWSSAWLILTGNVDDIQTRYPRLVPLLFDLENNKLQTYPSRQSAISTLSKALKKHYL